MAHFRVAKRYAKGFMDFLSGSDKEKMVMQEMLQLRDLVKSNRDLKNFFASPIIDYKKKTQIMNNVFADYSEESRTFLSLIIRQDRSLAIGEIAAEFIQLYKAKNNIKDATITSAQKLDQAQIDAILSKAKETLPSGTSLEVLNKVDPSLIGGFILRIDDKQFDASISSKMNKIRKEFDSKHYIPKV